MIVKIAGQQGSSVMDNGGYTCGGLTSRKRINLKGGRAHEHITGHSVGSDRTTKCRLAVL